MWLKSVTFPCVVGICYVFIEILLMTFVGDFVSALGASAVLCAGLSAWILIANRSFDRCGVFLITVCVLTFVIVLVNLLFTAHIYPNMVDIRIENRSFLMLAIHWGAPTLVCTAARFLDRRKRLKGFEDFFRLTSIVFFVIYLFSLFALLFFGSENRGSEYQGVNIVPFKTVWMYLTAQVLSDTTKILNLAGNIAIFIPLGFYLFVFSGKIRVPFGVLILLAVPVAVEALQYLTNTGACDIDDVMLNFIGGLLGMLLCFATEKVFRHFQKDPDAKLFHFRPK